MRMSADERFIREQIQKILCESSPPLLLENEFGDFASTNDMYKAFVAPFTNVFKVAKTAFKDITSSTITTLRHNFSFDNDFRKKMAAKQRSDRDKYRQEYATVMKDVDSALGSGDAALLAFMVNPGVFIGKAMFDQATDVGEPVIDFAKEKMGMFSPELDSLYRDVQTTSNTGKGPARGLLGDLKSLFFGEGYQHGPILEEEEKEEKEKEDTPTEELSEQETLELIDQAIQNSAWGKQLEEDAQELVNNKAQQIEEVKQAVKDQMAALNALVSARNLKEMQQPFNALKTMGIDLSQQMQEVEALVNQSKERLLGSSEANSVPSKQEAKPQPVQEDDEVLPETSTSIPNEEAQAIMDDLRNTPEGKALPKDAKPEDFGPLLEKGVIASAFQAGVGEARQELLQDVMDFVAEEMNPTDLKDLAKISPLGEKYSALIMNFAKELSEL